MESDMEMDMRKRRKQERERERASERGQREDGVKEERDRRESETIAPERTQLQARDLHTTHQNRRYSSTVGFVPWNCFNFFISFVFD